MYKYMDVATYFTQTTQYDLGMCNVNYAYMLPFFVKAHPMMLKYLSSNLATVATCMLAIITFIIDSKLMFVT